MIHDRTRMEEEKRRQEKIAASQASATPIIQQAPLQAPQMGGGGQSPLAQVGMQIGKKMLGGLFGGLFNQGGMVPPMGGYNKGGQIPWWKRAAKRVWGSKKGSNPNSIWAQTGRNMGGAVPNPRMMGPLNPNGYNEGGPVPTTPIKRVMDEDKIEIQRETFERAEARKDEKFALDEKRAAEKHAMDMKMKKQAAVTNKAPLAKK